MAARASEVRWISTGGLEAVSFRLLIHNSFKWKTIQDTMSHGRNAKIIEMTGFVGCRDRVGLCGETPDKTRIKGLYGFHLIHSWAAFPNAQKGRDQG